MPLTPKKPARGFGALALALLMLALSAGSLGDARQAQAGEPSLVAHEWGTFTSVAGADGEALEWLPWPTKSDLPEFVERNQNGVGKGRLRGTVRMETPVLYFYSTHDTSVSVSVSFLQGLITEWYPHAKAQPSVSTPITVLGPGARSSISWSDVSVVPNLSVHFPVEASASHYYAARETSAAPLLISSPGGDQYEKFLFYRGVAGFDLPISAMVLSHGQLQLQNRSAQEIPALILFERYSGRLGYKILPSLADSAVVETPSTSGTLDSLRTDFETLLVRQGLYPDEARAMVETWRDSWFEDGSRLFYIVPRAFVDSVLPLSIQPSPGQLTRVFVGRVELLTSATQESVEAALLSHDYATLQKQGRFLESIVELLSKRNPQSAFVTKLRRGLSDYLAWSQAGAATSRAAVR